MSIKKALATTGITGFMFAFFVTPTFASNDYQHHDSRDYRNYEHSYASNYNDDKCKMMKDWLIQHQDRYDKDKMKDAWNWYSMSCDEQHHSMNYDQHRTDYRHEDMQKYREDCHH